MKHTACARAQDNRFRSFITPLFFILLVFCRIHISERDVDVLLDLLKRRAMFCRITS
jgi:hypothetical protein